MSIQDIQNKALKNYKKVGLPTTKNESWRFTDISKIDKYNFNGNYKSSELPINPISEIFVVFENGKLSLEKSNIDNLPKGLVINSILENSYKNIGKLTDNDSGLVLYNTAYFSDGIYINVDQNIEINSTIHLIHLADSDMQSINLRNLINIGSGSKLKVLEEYIGNNSSTYWTNSVTEIYVADSADFDHYKIQNESKSAFHFETIESQVGENSRFENHVITTGSLIGRNDIRGRLLGKNSNVVCNGLYLLNESQLFDTHLFMDHAVESCNSHELYKGILADKAKGVFCGRILVQQDAQQTDAIQSNKNLLLSRSAKVNTMPQLEIYADDVKCTHGATIGELDNEALFYLQSRGINPNDAHALLTFAFANEVLDQVRCNEIKSKAELIIKNWLSKVV